MLTLATVASSYLLTRSITLKNQRLLRQNFAGNNVSLGGGIAVAAAAVVATSASANKREAFGFALPVACAAIVGAMDDGIISGVKQVSATREIKGFKGHLRALANGQVTTGLIKLVAIPAASLTGVLIQDGGAIKRDTLSRALAVAASANLINLFDLRPGRALKVSGAGASAILLIGLAGGAKTTTGVKLAASTLLITALALKDDLSAVSMLGDCGANSIGALLGCALASTPTAPRIIGVSGAIALIGASEKISFSQVIASTPWLNQLDQLGRRGN